MEKAWFGVAIFSTAIFLIQFILSFILGSVDLDTDIDIDGDGIGDFTPGDLVSFKGLIHFLIGFGWTMWFSKDSNQWFAACIAVIIGLVFVLVLALTYRLCGKFKNEIKPESGKDLIGRPFEVYLKLGSGFYTGFTIINGARTEIKVFSKSLGYYQVGETLEIIDYVGSQYIIN